MPRFRNNPYQRAVYDFAAPFQTPAPPVTTPELQPLLEALLEQIKPVKLLMLATTVGTDPQVIFTERDTRRYFLLQNLSASASTVWIAFGVNAVASACFEITAGNSIELRDPSIQDYVSVVCASGTATIVYAEG